jgi:hypothetical protein
MAWKQTTASGAGMLSAFLRWRHHGFAYSLDGCQPMGAPLNAENQQQG